MSTDRLSPSGSLTSLKGTLAIPLTAIEATAGGTATASFTGAVVGDVLEVSPRAALTGSTVSVAFSRIVAANIAVVGFTNAGASTNQAASTFDAVVHRR